MADNLTDINIGIQAGRLDQDASNRQNQPTTSQPDNVVKIREPFDIGGLTRIIYDISVDGGMKRTFGWKIKENSRVLIYGSNLGIYSQINLHIAGSSYVHRGIDRSPDGRLLGFEVSRELVGLYSQGQSIELEFVDPQNAANNRYLNEKFRYAGPEEDEEKQNKNKAAGETEESGRQRSSGRRQGGFISDVVNQSVGGVPEAVIRGAGATAAEAPNIKTNTARTSAVKSGNSEPGDNYDVDEAGSSQESLNTAEVEVNSQAAVQGQAEGHKGSIAARGTGGEVSASTQVRAGTEVSTQGEANAEASGTTSATAQISGSSSQTVAANNTGSVQTEVSAAAQASLSGQEQVNSEVSGQGQQNTSVNSRAESSVQADGNTSVSAGVQNNLSVDNKSEVDSEIKTENSVQTPGIPAQQAPKSAEEQASVESLAESEQDNGALQPEPKNVQNQSGVVGSGINSDQEAAEPGSLGQPKENENKTLEKSDGQPVLGKGQIDGVNKQKEGQSTPNQRMPQPASPSGIEGALNKFGANDALLKSKLGQNTPPAGAATGNKEAAQAANKAVSPAQAGSDAEDKEDLQSADNIQQGRGADAAAAENLQAANALGLGGSRGAMEGTPDEQKSGAEGEAEQSENSPQQQEGQEPDSEDQEFQALPYQSAAARSAAAKVQEEIAEAEKLVNKAVNAYLQTLAKAVWASAIPTLGLSILLGAIVGDFLWLLKDWAVKKAIKIAPLPAKLKKYATADLKIKFSLSIKIQIAAMNFIIFALVAFIFVFVLSILWGVCNSWWTAYPVNNWGLQPACEYINKTKVGGALSSLQPSGSYVASYNTPGNLISTSQWTQQINSAAQKWNIDACILRVVVQKESGGNGSAIGCDCAANGHPEYCPDKRKTYSSDYQFNWAQCSYGIGLTQWTIYPAGGSGYKAWQAANVPSRNLYSSWYGVSDFLNPVTSLDLTAQAFSMNLAKANGDVSAAFAAYVGASNVQAQLVADRMALYNLCKNSSTP